MRILVLIFFRKPSLNFLSMCPSFSIPPMLNVDGVVYPTERSEMGTIQMRENLRMRAYHNLVTTSYWSTQCHHGTILARQASLFSKCLLRKPCFVAPYGVAGNFPPCLVSGYYVCNFVARDGILRPTPLGIYPHTTWTNNLLGFHRF